MKEFSITFGIGKQHSFTISYSGNHSKDQSSEVAGTSLLDILKGMTPSEKKAALQYLLKNAVEVEND